MNGNSYLTVVSLISNGVIHDVTPKMINILRILEPRTFPTAISTLPFNAEVMDTAASGALVPIATMVNPTTRAGIPNLLAMPLAPSTSQSAPLISIKNPKIKSPMFFINSIIFLFPFLLTMQ